MYMQLIQGIFLCNGVFYFFNSTEISSRIIFLNATDPKQCYSVTIYDMRDWVVGHIARVLN